jgi:hypothetical protein
MIKGIALALAIAAIPATAAAQSTDRSPSKVIEITPSGTVVQTCNGGNCGLVAAPPNPAPVQPTPSKVIEITPSGTAVQTCNGGNCGPPKPPPEEWNTTPPATIPTELLDGCIIDVIGRLPKAEGLRVTSSSYKFRDSIGQRYFWKVSVSVDVHGHKATYSSTCRIERGSAELSWF